MSAAPKDRRLKVLTLVDGIGTFGGGERLARQITTHLDPARFEATLCVSRWEPDPLHDAALDELKAADVAFLGLQRSSRLQLRPWRQLVAYMQDWGADVLHAHKIGSNIWGALIGLILLYLTVGYYVGGAAAGRWPRPDDRSSRPDDCGSSRYPEEGRHPQGRLAGRSRRARTPRHEPNSDQSCCRAYLRPPRDD